MPGGLACIEVRVEVTPFLVPRLCFTILEAADSKEQSFCLQQDFTRQGCDAGSASHVLEYSAG